MTSSESNNGSSSDSELYVFSDSKDVENPTPIPPLSDIIEEVNEKEEKKFQEAHQKTRIVYVNDMVANHHFTSNYVRTAKYTFYSFLFRYLFEQFMRIANLYFLLISVLQLIPGLSPTGSFTTLLGLIAVLVLNAIKEIFEDVGRHKQDNQINHLKVDVLRKGEFVRINWQDVKVGEIVKLTDREGIPADLIILSSSGPNGSCYIETSSLDGETNLKIRQAIPITNKFNSHKTLSDFKGIIECENLNNKLYEFEGNIKLSAEDNTLHSLTMTQLLLRGATIRDTKLVYGVVVNTGKDTKLVQNSSKRKIKRSNVERQANIQIILIFALLGIMCGVSTVGGALWESDQEEGAWYLYLLENNNTTTAIKNLFTFMILFYNLIPISLYISLEFVKVGQGYFMNNDLEMYDEDNGIAAQARTTNLNEELGQVQYVFTDKTGTLTRNLMQFYACSISGHAYGDLEGLEKQEAKENLKRSQDSTNGKEEAALETIESLVNFKDKKFLKNLQAGNENSLIMEEFLLTLAVCHTVVPEVDEEDNKKINYQAASPDEAALVAFAKEMGYVFTEREPDSITISVNGTLRKYEILNIIEFTSTRKRMSVIVRNPEGKIRLYCKGADSVIGSRLASNQDFWSATLKDLENFGLLGLRTLVLAFRDIDNEAYNKWALVMHQASVALRQREELINQAAELMERDLQLIGATAIEDRLQDGVPKAIKTLAQAGIKIWMLTGDKQETAINIGFSCLLLTERMERLIINETTKQKTQKKLETLLEEYAAMETTDSLALIIDGITLTYALEDDLKLTFLKLAIKCNAVICCRVSPLQKAQVVLLVRENMRAICLAIGDGGNDVSMIQAAHVGVGIQGKEGTQAARAADYSIGQFRFLVILLLKHGFRSYRAITRLIQYSFYKNICLVLTQFWFTTQSGFSGQTFYEKWTLSFYNVFFTFIPIVSFGIFDKAISTTFILANPDMYKLGQQNYLFKNRHMIAWVTNAVFHATMIFWVTYFIFRNDIQYNGKQLGLWGWGYTSFTCILFVVTLKIAVETRYWVWIHHCTVWGSLLTWFVFNIVYAPLWESPALQVGSEAYWTFYLVMSSPLFWFSVILTTTIALWREITWKFWRRTYYPKLYHVIQEQEMLFNSEQKVGIKKSSQKRDHPNTGFSFSDGISVKHLNGILKDSNIQPRKIEVKSVE